MASFALVPSLRNFVSEAKYSSGVKKTVEDQFLGSFFSR